MSDGYEPRGEDAACALRFLDNHLFQFKAVDADGKLCFDLLEAARRYMADEPEMAYRALAWLGAQFQIAMTEGYEPR